MKQISLPIAKLLILSIIFVTLLSATYIWFSNHQARQAKIDVTTIFKELKEVSRLETATYTTEQIVDASRSDNSVWKDFLFGDRILLIAHGKIVAGIDLEKLTPDSIKVQDKQVVLTLPAAEIFSSSLDESKTRVYNRTTGLFNSGDINLESEARQEATQKLSKAACESSILQQATDNAQHQLKALLKGLAFEEVVVLTTPASC
jgi:hypothetical protein